MLSVETAVHWHLQRTAPDGCCSHDLPQHEADLVRGERSDTSFPEPTTGTIAIEDEFFYVLFRPLTLTNQGRNEAVRIEEREGYLSIQLINYEGPGRNFSRKELLNTLNGFVAELGGVKDYGSFEEFRRTTAGGMLSERVLANQRVARYSRKGVVLELSHSLTYDGLKYASIDEKMQPRPAFEIGGARS